MPKHYHEVRDPIHGFIRLDSQERKVVDSRPFQRLRHIHQLALTYLVYPGATHRRFEHSLGVMELAGRVFDVITAPANRDSDAAQAVIPVPDDLPLWKRTLRMAALVHDVGHLPFSHAGEDNLPEGWNHERITDEIVLGDGMKDIWEEINVRPKHVAKLALGPKKFGPGKHRTETFTPWEAILSEIIVGDAFGVDRMDYLLRDSYHAGVAYGRFDHFRLIDTLRILPSSSTEEPTLGIEAGGIHTAEALLLARYFMYTQLYFHPVRRAYDHHLQQYLKASLDDGMFPTNPEKHLDLTDNEITANMYVAARNPEARGHAHAKRIVQRQHFRLLYQRNPQDLAVNPDAARQIAAATTGRFGHDSVHSFIYPEKSRPLDFPVRIHDGRVASSLNASVVLERLPLYSVGYVFVAPEIKGEAEAWLAKERGGIISTPPAGAQHEPERASSGPVVPAPEPPG